MQDHIILGLSFIIAIGVLAQWVAMQMKLPSILFLLVFGCVAGPITGVIKPDLILGDLLFPIVSLSVAIILFEGGTDLKLNELKEIGKVVLNMITIGVLVTWVLISAAAYIFQEQYTEVALQIDEIAERIRSLGHFAPGAMSGYLEQARLQETGHLDGNAQAMLKQLLADHELIVRSLRVDLETAMELGDAGTSDFLTGLMEIHEKMAWMVRAHL